jgi:hypothetical protein
MIKINKPGLEDSERQIQDIDLDKYLQAGWQQSDKALVKDTTSSKPTVVVTAAVKSAVEQVETLDKENDDGNGSW